MQLSINASIELVDNERFKEIVKEQNKKALMTKLRSLNDGQNYTIYNDTIKEFSDDAEIATLAVRIDYRALQFFSDNIKNNK